MRHLESLTYHMMVGPRQYLVTLFYFLPSLSPPRSIIVLQPLQTMTPAAGTGIIPEVTRKNLTTQPQAQLDPII